MKTVLFILSTTVRSGPTRQLLNLCKNLPSLGYNPYILTLSPDPVDSMAAQFDDLGIERQTLGLSRVSGLFLAKARTRDLVRKVKPDIIHTSGIRSDFLGHAISGEIPHVMTVRNYAWEDYPAKYGRIRGSLMASKHIGLINTAALPVACSRTLAERFRNKRHVAAVPNGIDTEMFFPVDPTDRAEIRKTLGLSAKRCIILSVGSLIPRKDPHTLLKSFIEFSDIATELVYLGGGSLRESLEAACQGRGDVQFRGNVANVVDFLQCADIYVSASRSEGLPNGVLEALACGLPVVLSDIGPHREFGVERFGAGRLAKIGDPQDFSKKMTDVLSRSSEEMSRNARNLAVQEFSAQKMARRYADLYAEAG